MASLQQLYDFPTYENVNKWNGTIDLSCKGTRPQAAGKFLHCKFIEIKRRNKGKTLDICKSSSF